MELKDQKYLFGSSPSMHWSFFSDKGCFQLFSLLPVILPLFSHSPPYEIPIIQKLLFLLLHKYPFLNFSSLTSLFFATSSPILPLFEWYHMLLFLHSATKIGCYILNLDYIFFPDIIEGSLGL